METAVAASGYPPSRELRRRKQRIIHAIVTSL